MSKEIAKQNESEYKEILRQVVALISQARAKVARQLNVGENAAYWEIGKMLQERKLESKHGNSVGIRERDFPQHLQFGFSRRNGTCFGAGTGM